MHGLLLRKKDPYSEISALYFPAFEPNTEIYE